MLLIQIETRTCFGRKLQHLRFKFFLKRSTRISHCTLFGVSKRNERGIAKQIRTIGNFARRHLTLCPIKVLYEDLLFWKTIKLERRHIYRAIIFVFLRFLLKQIKNKSLRGVCTFDQIFNPGQLSRMGKFSWRDEFNLDVGEIDT